MVERMEALLVQATGPLSFVVIIPTWTQVLAWQRLTKVMRWAVYDHEFNFYDHDHEFNFYSYPQRLPATSDASRLFQSVPILSGCASLVAPLNDFEQLPLTPNDSQLMNMTSQPSTQVALATRWL